MNSSEELKDIEDIPPAIYKRIVDQANVAIRKLNRNSYLTVSDLISEGLMTYVRALRSYNGKDSAFETYLIHCLKGCFVKIIRDSFAKKRGGYGERRLNHYGRDRNDQELSFSVMVPIDETVQIADDRDDTEYNILVSEVEQKLPKKLLPLYRQLTNPDPELIEKAHLASKDKNKCVLTTNMIADYLGVSVSEVLATRRLIQQQLKGVL